MHVILSYGQRMKTVLVINLAVHKAGIKHFFVKKKHICEYHEDFKHLPAGFLGVFLFPKADKSKLFPVYKAWSTGGPTAALHVPLHAPPNVWLIGLL